MLTKIALLLLSNLPWFWALPFSAHDASEEPTNFRSDSDPEKRDKTNFKRFMLPLCIQSTCNYPESVDLEISVKSMSGFI